MIGSLGRHSSVKRGGEFSCVWIVIRKADESVFFFRWERDPWKTGGTISAGDHSRLKVSIEYRQPPGVGAPSGDPRPA